LALAGALRDVAQERLAGALAALWSALESTHTRRAYASDWMRFSAFLVAAGAHPLTAGPVEVGSYLENLRARGLARSTRGRALSVLKEVFAALYRAGLRAENPAREFRLPKVQREPRTPSLTVAQLVALLKPAGDSWVARRDRVVLLTLLGLALRRASVAGARVEHLVRRSDGRLGLHVLAKGGKQANLLLPVWLAAEIESWIAFSGASGPLFPRLRRVGFNDMRPEMDRPIGASKVWDIVKSAAKRAGIDEKSATPHAIRRSYVTISRTRGVSLDDLQSALMHAQITTTMLYDKSERAMKSAPGDVLDDIYRAANTEEGTVKP
jgi:integrase/recombinase XerD